MNPCKRISPLMASFMMSFTVLLSTPVLPAPASGADAAPEAPAIGTAEGQQHPDFLLPSLDGGYLRLSDYRGKKVFLFHFASW